MLNSTKIILTGGAGLVGQNLIVHLQRIGFNHLVVLDKHHTNMQILRRLHPNITAVEADLADYGAWEQHFSGASAVVMLHAQIGGLDAVQFQRNNLDATRNVLAACQRGGVPYVVHVSSSVVESVANDWYTRTKKAQEQMVQESDMAYVILRPTLMFGWFDRKHLGWLSRFMRRIPVFPIPGHGRYIRQPLYVGDFCQIISSCLHSGISGQIFNISGIERINYIDIIRQIKKAIGARTRIVKIPYGLFDNLLQIWAMFDHNPPFTSDQLRALIACDIFEVIDWPGIFGVSPTPLNQALHETFTHPIYSRIVLDF